MFNSKSMRAKITLWSGICLLLSMTVLIGFSAWSSRTQSIKASRAQAISEAKIHAAQSEAEIENALDAVRTMAHILTAAKDSRTGMTLSREDVIWMLQTMLENNPNFLAVYTLWEPDAFDQMDIVFAGTKQHDQTGHFVPYVFRDNNEMVKVIPQSEYQNATANEKGIWHGEVYLKPREFKREYITNPHNHQIGDREVFLTSMAVPIIVEGRFLGVAGVDVSLETFQQRADELASRDQGIKLALISNNGTIAGVTGHPELVGQHFSKFDDDFSEDLKFIQQGKEAEIEDDGKLELITPIFFGGTETPWASHLSVPMSVITAEATMMMWKMVGLGLICLLVALVLLWVTAGGLAKPIIEAILNLSKGANRFSAIASEVACSSQQIAEGANEQASSFEQTSGALEEMSSMTGQNADNASTCNSMMGQTKQTVIDGGVAVKEMSGAMSQINISSEETRRIIKTIEEIAFQTNLLALNAAVEAARAGDAGRGFAVVADEVRSLAQRAAEAAKDTSQLIQGTVDRIKGGTRIVQELETNFRSITQGTDEVAALVAEIASASREQARGIEQVNMAITQVDQVTQNNASSAQLSAATSQELSAQAAQVEIIVQSLIDIVGRATLSNKLIQSRKNSEQAPASANNDRRPDQKTLKQKQLSPQQMIPLNEEEEAEFINF